MSLQINTELNDYDITFDITISDVSSTYNCVFLYPWLYINVEDKDIKHMIKCVSREIEEDNVLDFYTKGDSCHMCFFVSSSKDTFNFNYGTTEEDVFVQSDFTFELDKGDNRQQIIEMLNTMLNRNKIN